MIKKTPLINNNIVQYYLIIDTDQYGMEKSVVIQDTSGKIVFQFNSVTESVTQAPQNTISAIDEILTTFPAPPPVQTYSAPKKSGKLSNSNNLKNFYVHNITNMDDNMKHVFSKFYNYYLEKFESPEGWKGKANVESLWLKWKDNALKFKQV